MQLHTNPAPANNDVTLSLTRSQILALKTFLERAEIKGYEVNRFLEIARLITEAEQRPAFKAPPSSPLTPDTKPAKA